jgi:hypothetical protein
MPPEVVHTFLFRQKDLVTFLSEQHIHEDIMTHYSALPRIGKKCNKK